ncbi:MAG: hypothetical protein ACXAB7_08580 [Candidatus Kariarchaeaceae archaeon]|jgi:hypothetical protein
MTTSLEINQKTNHLISQVYIMHETGVVLVSRIYNDSCIVGDSQLIGGFISSLVLFFNDVSSDCYRDGTSGHNLDEIAITCSRLVIERRTDLLVVAIVPQDSALLRGAKRTRIKKVMGSIYDAFESYKLLDTAGSAGLENYIDYSDGFSSVLDKSLIDALDEMRKQLRLEKSEIISLFNGDN